jgi:hypothetical protein
MKEATASILALSLFCISDSNIPTKRYSKFDRQYVLHEKITVLTIADRELVEISSLMIDISLVLNCVIAAMASEYFTLSSK